MTIKEYALKYRIAGWNVIPLKDYSKNPATVTSVLPSYWVIDTEKYPEENAQWQEQQPEDSTKWIQKRGWVPYKLRFSTDEEFDRMFSIPEVTGLGVITGSISGIYVLDEDSYKEGGTKIKQKTEMISQSLHGGKHFYFRFDENTKNIGYKKGVFVEGKGTGGFIVLPPSQVRKEDNSIGSYNWISKCQIKDLPLINLEEISNIAKSNEGEKFDRNEVLDRGKGERHPTLIQYSTSLWNDIYLERITEEVGVQMLEAANSTYQPNPKPQQEINKIWSDAKKYVYGNPPTLRHKSESHITHAEAVLPPKTLGEIGKIRVEERKLERKAAKTGYPELDELIKGFIPKHIYTLTGETNVGKTAFACNFAQRQSEQNRKTLYIALEPDSTVVDYLASIRLKIPFDKITDEDALHEDENIFIYTSEVRSMNGLKEVITAAGDKYSLVIIDHIGYFIDDVRNYIQEQAKLIKELATFANDTRIAILIIAHLRKPVRSKKDQTPTINDISGSAAFKQDSDEVLIVVKAKDPLDQFNLKYSDRGYMFVAKTKTSGGNGVVNLIFHPKSALIQTPEEILHPDYLKNIPNEQDAPIEDNLIEPYSDAVALGEEATYVG